MSSEKGLLEPVTLAGEVVTLEPLRRDHAGALAVAAADGRLRPGARVLLGAFGAGLAWGGTVLTWGNAPLGAGAAAD